MKYKFDKILVRGRELDEGGGGSVAPSAGYEDVTALDSGNTKTFTDNIPGGIKAPSNKFYGIEKGALTIDPVAGTATLDFTAYLVYEGMSSFSGTWRVYFTSGPAGIGVVPGTIHAFAGIANKIPAGFLLCNGAAISRTDYAALFTVIGTIYGSGDGSTTFNLPDFRGKFLRGYLDGTSAALGTAQGDAIRNIYGNVGSLLSYQPSEFSWTNGAFKFASDGQTTITTGGSDTRRVARLIVDASQSIPTAAENRPANFAINWIIKY